MTDREYTKTSEHQRQQFYTDLCGLIEKHGDEDIDVMIELIESLDTFRDSWMDTASVTGRLWINATERKEE